MNSMQMYCKFVKEIVNYSLGCPLDALFHLQDETSTARFHVHEARVIRQRVFIKFNRTLS